MTDASPAETAPADLRMTVFDRCLACGGTDLKPYLDLGAQPLANAFAMPGVRGQRLSAAPVFPLGLKLCRSCFHSQNVGAVDPDLLYRDYAYVSGTSASLGKYFGEFVWRVENDFDCGMDTPRGTKRHLRVLEIACNDGTLLGLFQTRGHAVVGVDPAENLFDAAPRAGIPVHIGFWGHGWTENMIDGPFDVIVAMNVLGHVDDPLTFLQLAKRVLSPGGRIYVQTSQAHMVENAEFDTVYHEHLSFFTARSFAVLAERAGLAIAKIEEVSVHGGSHLVTLIDDEGKDWPFPIEAIAAEDKRGVYDAATYDNFQQRVRDRLDIVRQALTAYRGGRRVVGYGAAAKAMTFFNALEPWAARFRLGVGVGPGGRYAPGLGVGSQAVGGALDYFVDDNPMKLHRLCPGLGIPVLSPAVLAEESQPLLVVIGAWNMADEIVARVKQIRPGKRDLFLAYFPTLNVRELE